MLESRWPHKGIDWHGSWRLIRTLMYVGVKERVFSSWGTAWQIQRYGNGMNIQFYYRLILCRFTMPDMIIWEGKDFTCLECGVGKSRLWWQPWGGRHSRTGLEEPGEGACKLSGLLCEWKLPSNPGRREKFRKQIKGHLLGQKPQERQACVKPGNAVGCQEREQEKEIKTFVEAGGEAPIP